MGNINADFSERQAARQKIIDAQVEQLRKIKNREDEILNKQIKEAEIKAEENERIKREKREELKVKQRYLPRGLKNVFLEIEND